MNCHIFQKCDIVTIFTTEDVRSLKLGTEVHKPTPTSRSSTHCQLLISLVMIYLFMTTPNILYMAFEVQ